MQKRISNLSLHIGVFEIVSFLGWLLRQNNHYLTALGTPVSSTRLHADRPFRELLAAYRR